MASDDPRIELLCSVCLEIYTDPVTLPCGHNFCRVCITQTWDNQDDRESTCPECRRRYIKRPVLEKNTRLQNLAEKFCFAQSDNKSGIFCNNCVYYSVPAEKSCLLCEVSLCVAHLRVHSRTPEHVLSEPMTSFENRKCSIHKRILEYYCTEDNACICVSCSLVGEHHGHKSETLEKASTEKKNTLKHLLQVMTSTQRETENRLHSLEKRKRKVQEKAAGLTDNVHVMVRDLKKQLDELEEQARSEVSTQEEQIILAISDMSQQLEKQRDELSEKKKHTEKLCNMNDPLTILQDKESRISDDNPYDYYEKLIQIGGVDLARIMQTLDTGLSDILSATEKNQLYIQEASDLLIDAHSAAKDVDVSTDLKTASWSVLQSQYPENKQRFEYNQVLCTGTFSSGKHLWKVETSNEGEWKLGICYATMDRRGYQSVIGNNDKSWCLHRYNAQYSVIHDSTTVRLPHQPSCSKLRIVLDYEAGQLSFSELCEPVRHLHTFTATFTEPLYPVFYLWINAWVKILD